MWFATAYAPIWSVMDRETAVIYPALLLYATIGLPKGGSLNVPTSDEIWIKQIRKN